MTSSSPARSRCNPCPRSGWCRRTTRALVTKINSTLVNTVPLWETQLAQAITIQRSADAAEAVARRQ